MIFVHLKLLHIYMCIYWTHERLIFWFIFVSDCTLHFVVIRFFKEALKFIDILSLIPRPHPPFVAVLQASLVWTWEWDYKFMYTCQPVWAKACVGLINLQLSHKDVLAKGQIYTQLVTCPDHFWKGVRTVHKTNSASAQNSLQLPKWMGGAGECTCHYQHGAARRECIPRSVLSLLCIASINSLFPYLLPERLPPPLAKVSRFHENVTSAREEEGWH